MPPASPTPMLGEQEYAIIAPELGLGSKNFKCFRLISYHSKIEIKSFIHKPFFKSLDPVTLGEF